MVAKTKVRILSYDIIRILAILMVVMIHVSSPYLKNAPVLSIDFFWGAVCNGLSRIAVPLFVMLSGALMLDEERKLDTLKIKKSILGVAFLLVSWSLIYASIYEVALPLLHGEAISVRAFVHAFLLGHYHLWFLYMILGLYLITPILRLFVKRENKKFIVYFCALSLVFQFSIPLINFFLQECANADGLFEDFLSKFRMGFVSPFITYYLLGWYISNVPIKKDHRVVIYGLGLFSLAMTILAVLAFSAEGNTEYKIFYNNESVNILIIAVALFLFIYSALQDAVIRNDFMAHVVQQASVMSFGVYVVHILVLGFLQQFLFLGSSGCSIPLIWFLTIIISYTITWIASKIPYVHKLFKC